MSRVLLIEDDPRVVLFVRRGLAAEGFAVDVAENGEDGLEFCRSNDYDLVVLDRMLPGMEWTFATVCSGSGGIALF